MYSGNLFWHEAGYRFSWRVMLIEKPSWATFFIKDSTGKEEEVDLSDWLTVTQEKMVSSQPDMIVQFAGILRDKYKSIQDRDIKVRAEVWTSLNGRRSQLLIDPFRDISKIENTWAERDYVLSIDSVISPTEFPRIKKQLLQQSDW